MTDKAVSALTSLTGANTATGDLVYIVDISEASASDRSKKITAQELQNYMKKFPATIGVGNATPAASGAGVSFPATISASSDANTLDDYEEGTWTPVYSPATGSFTTLTMGTADSYYTKVGNIVVVQSYVATDNVDATGASGALSISGLPFTTGGRSSVSLSRVTGWAGDSPIDGYADISGTTIQIYYRTSVNGADTAVQVSDMTTGATGNQNVVVVTLIYRVA